MTQSLSSVGRCGPSSPDVGEGQGIKVRKLFWASPLEFEQSSHSFFPIHSPRSAKPGEACATHRIYPPGILELCNVIFDRGFSEDGKILLDKKWSQLNTAPPSPPLTGHINSVVFAT